MSLSKSKLLTSGKVADALAQKDKEVASDLAVVLSAGLVAERLAEEREEGIKANPTCAAPDHELMCKQLTDAGLSKHFDLHEDAAKQLLGSQWSLVSSLAAYLLENVSVESEAVKAFIEERS